MWLMIKTAFYGKSRKKRLLNQTNDRNVFLVKSIVF